MYIVDTYHEDIGFTHTFVFKGEDIYAECDRLDSEGHQIYNVKTISGTKMTYSILHHLGRS